MRAAELGTRETMPGEQIERQRQAAAGERFAQPDRFLQGPRESHCLRRRLDVDAVEDGRLGPRQRQIETSIASQQFIQGRGRTGLAQGHCRLDNCDPACAAERACRRMAGEDTGQRMPRTSGRQAGQLFAPPVQLAAGDFGFLDAQCGVGDFMAEAGQRGNQRAFRRRCETQGQRQFGMRQRPLRLETR